MSNEYAWLHDEFGDGAGDTWLCVTFARGLSPEEALGRSGVVPGNVAGEFGVAAYEADGGTVLADYGWGTSLTETQKRLSQDTTTALVFFTVKSDDVALFADGERIVRFSPYAYTYRDGEVPQHLIAYLKELGLDRDDRTEDPVPKALALAARATGVRFTPAHFVREPLGGSSDHLQ
ncbi:DUF6461 domain-containing protein [Nonomuraea typhae]|uniref:DUF6461 domain-containing protein n=1 Tax=Nonomuraea typhae TaxID=2603600 RepID=UPI0012FA3F4C|nr:DUF6461 domain-containing protein [Nonomuraea typhae]